MNADKESLKCAFLWGATRFSGEIETMKWTPIVCLAFMTASLFAQMAQHSGMTRPNLAKAYGHLPLYFEKNVGQTDSDVRFLSRGAGYGLFLTSTEAVLDLRSSATRGAAGSEFANKANDPRLLGSSYSKRSVVRMRFIGASETSQVGGLDELQAKSNYFTGNDSGKWISGIPTFSKVQYSQLYPGVGLVFYGVKGHLEYDLQLAPNVDPGMIRIGIGGTKALSLTKSGDLSIKTEVGTLLLQKPNIYQAEGPERKQIRGEYVMRGADEVGIKIGPYDKSKSLVVDPVLIYSTYLGGTGQDWGLGGTVDAQGNAYVVGLTTSPDFPSTKTVGPAAPEGSQVAFVSKFNPGGTALIYSTFLSGGANYGGSQANGIAVDANGFAYVTGNTTSETFPVTASAYQSSPVQTAKRTVFVSKLSADGQSLLYSTYLGGNGDQWSSKIAVDTHQVAYLGGAISGSGSFPVTANAFQSTNRASNGNAFVSKIDTTQSGSGSLLYSTFLGGSTGNGSNGEALFGLALDANANVYVVGYTFSSDFPVTSSAYQGTSKAQLQMATSFLSRFDTTKSGAASLIYSTYFGGSAPSNSGQIGDESNAVTTDTSGKVYVTGMTMSPDFPVTVGSPATGGEQGFVSKFDLTKLNSASLIYSRAFGSSSGTVTGNAVGVDAGGNAYVAGSTTDPLYPVTPDAVQSNLKSSAGNGFLTSFNGDASTITYSTYFGSSNIGPPEGYELPAGSLTNVVYTNVVSGGPFTFFFTGWDINSATGDIYAAVWHTIGNATAITHLTLAGSVLTMDVQCTYNPSGCTGSPSPLNLLHATGLLADPADNTLLLSGTVGSSYESVKYDYLNGSVLATYGGGGIIPDFTVNLAPGVQRSDKYMWTNGTVYSAHDFSVVSTTNTGGYGSGTFGTNELEWDGGHYILGAGGGNGSSLQTASYDMSNVSPSGFSKLVDPNAPNNYTDSVGNGLSIVPGASYALSHQNSAPGFVDFYTFPQMSLLAHQAIAGQSYVVADAYNIAYVVDQTSFTVTKYDMTTGNNLGVLGTFTDLQKNCGTWQDGGVGILNHPVYGTWIVMHANGCIQGMFIRADVPYTASSGDYINSVALDPANNIYIFGLTNGFDLPTSQQLFQPTQQGASDAFVAKFGGISTPTITSLSLASGRVGANLTITGVNFGSSGTVTFNGVRANWSNWTANSIAVSVPSGAKTGNVVVTSGGIASNGVGFTVLSGSVPVVLVQHASVNGGTNSKAVLAFGGNNVAGNWIGVCVRASGTNQVLSVSDTNGNLYRQAVAVNETGGGNTLAVFYAENISNGPNTVTVSDTVASSLEMVILEYSGLALYNSLDVTSSAIGNSTSPASGATTTTVSGDLLLGSIMSASGTTFTAGTGYTKEDNVPAAPSTQLIAEDESQVQSGNASATATLAASGYWAAALAAFKIGTITTGTSPTIAKITPVTGNAGTPVTITGYNFGAVQGTSTVQFNGTPATTNSWSDTSIVVPAPAGFTDGNIIVTVGGVPSNGIWFAQPLIASTSPSSGAVGSPLTINGTHFGSSQGVVKFNGTPVTSYGPWTATSVAVTIPAGATAGPLVVVNSNGIVSNEYTFNVTGTVPAVTSISPTSGSAGTLVTVTGYNFGSSQGSSTVTFNGVPAGTAGVWGVNSIQINAPSGVTTGNVVVTVGGKSDLQTNVFTVSGTPSVSGISPSRGGVGVDVLITGSNLGSSGTVKFNGVTASPWSWSSTVISVPVPPGATSGMITVTAGSTQISAGTFDVRSAVPATATEFSYDAMGRVIQKTICTPMSCGTGATPQNLTATYDLGGDLTSVSYNGPIIGYPNIDALGRVTSVTSTWNDSQHPATLATVDPTNGYWPTGQLRKFALPNGLTESTVYNSRVQPCRINVNSSGTLLSTCSDALPTGSKQDFNVGFNAGTGINNPGTDNGNVATFVGSGQQNFNRSYQYDKLNRIQSMSAPGDVCSGLSWTIDAWGNRTAQTATAGTCFQSSVAVNAANQLIGSSYDAAGNLLNDGNHTYTYDAEGRISTVDGGQTATYVYDAFGMRVAKYVGSADYEYVYDQDNRLIAEFNNGVFQRGYVYMGGQQLAEYFENTTYTVLSDFLGSTRLLGKLNQSIRESDDYYPYGESITAPSSGDILKFTGKERDSESGLDEFGVRHYASSLGRFMQADPLFATPLHLIDPQRWNMYAYVVNNPTNYIDPDGRDAIAVNFTKEVPIGGHEGIIVVHADGSATYARFGPVHEASPADAGKVTIQNLDPVQFGDDGLPTGASYQHLADQVAKLEGQAADTVRMNYFKTSEADSIALDTWIQQWRTAHAPDYRVNSQNCAVFCIAGLIQSHAIKNERISIVPNNLFGLLISRANENWIGQEIRPKKEKVTSKICWTDEKGHKHCQ